MKRKPSGNPGIKRQVKGAKQPEGSEDRESKMVGGRGGNNGEGQKKKTGKNGGELSDGGKRQNADCFSNTG